MEVKDRVSKLELTSEDHESQLGELKLEKLKEAEIKKQLIEQIQKLEAQVKENTLALGRATENTKTESNDIFKRLAALQRQVQDNTAACKVTSQLTEKAESQLKEAEERFKKLETQIAEIQTSQKELKDSSESKLKAMKNELEKYMDEKFNAQIQSGYEIDSINNLPRYLSKSTSNLSDSGLEKSESSHQRARSSENLLSDDKDPKLLNKSKLQPRDTSTPRKDASPNVKQKTKTKY